MGFNIKNNYGPNIEVNAGGKVTLTQDRSGLWHTVDAEEAEYEEVTTPQVPQQVVPVAKKDYGTPQTDADFKAVFDNEKEEKEVLKETAQQEVFLHFYEMQYNRFCEQWYSYRSRIVEILKEDLSNRRKCNKFYALKDEVWKNLYESKFLDALKDGINIYDIDDYRKEHPGTDKSEDEIREVLALAEMVDDDNNPYKEKIGKYIFEHRKTLSFEDISSFFVYLDAIPFILKNIEKLREENCDETVAPQLSANDSTSEVEQDNPSCPLNSISPFTPAVIDTTKADVVIALLRQLMEGKTKPKDVLMPVRAAMDAGVIRRPTWEEFCQEFGLWRVKNKSSFSDYTNPDNQPYIGIDFELIKDKFRQLMSEGQ